MELLEREGVLADLVTCLDDAAAGTGRLVLLSGEAGAGKSVLLRRFSDLVRAPVLWGACDPLSSPRPLGPLTDIAPHLGLEVVDLLRSGVRDGAFEAGLRALQARSGPTVVIFEDVHWADASTLDFLRFLGRRIATTGVLLVVSYRDDQLAPADPLRLVLGDLASTAWVRRAHVPPLSVAAVARLAQGTGLDAADLHRETGGNPFFVAEVISSGGDRLPATVSDAVLARVARLSPAAQVALTAAAVIGARIEPSLVLTIEGVGSSALDECVSKGFLRFDPPHFVFRHELVRQAVLQGVAPVRLAQLHAQVLAVLRELSLDPKPLARLADHAESAGDSAAVLEFALAAGDSASQLKAHREAAFQYARALRFAGGMAADERIPLLEKRSYECYVTDMIGPAIRATTEVIALARELDRPLVLGENLSWLSRLLWTSGRHAEAEESVRDAMSVLEPLPPGRELAKAYANQAQLLMVRQDYAPALTWGQRALDLARQLGERAIIAHALNTIGSALWFGGDVGGEPLLLESLQIALDDKLDDDVARAFTNLASAARSQLDFETAVRYSDQGITFCTDHDLDSARLCMLTDRAVATLQRAEWAQAEATAESLLDNLVSARITRIPATVVLALVQLRRGDGDVWDLLDDALDQATPTEELQFLGPVAAARAEAWWLTGRPERMAAELRTSFDEAVRANDRWFLGELAFWLWRAGELDQAPPGAPVPFALQISGDWAGAAAAWTELGMPYEAAVALVDSPHETDLRTAIAQLDAVGARPMVAMAAERLRAMGVSNIPRGVQTATRANPGGLTNRQLQVLSLLEEGLRNAEIAGRLYLSEKTVAHHVSAVLAKLDVTSRAEAARKARDLLPASG